MKIATGHESCRWKQLADNRFINLCCRILRPQTGLRTKDRVSRNMTPLVATVSLFGYLYLHARSISSFYFAIVSRHCYGVLSIKATDLRRRAEGAKQVVVSLQLFSRNMLTDTLTNNRTKDLVIGKLGVQEDQQ